MLIFVISNVVDVGGIGKGDEVGGGLAEPDQGIDNTLRGMIWPVKGINNKIGGMRKPDTVINNKIGGMI